MWAGGRGGRELQNTYKPQPPPSVPYTPQGTLAYIIHTNGGGGGRGCRNIHKRVIDGP